MYAKDVSNYFAWDDGIKEVNKKAMEQQISTKRGGGGTSPEVVAREMIKKNYKNLILITDGQISDSSVKNCDSILNNYKFNKSICYIIESAHNSHLNMSVTCAFTRNCESEVY
jgi:hypothetical protein